MAGFLKEKNLNLLCLTKYAGNVGGGVCFVTLKIAGRLMIL